VFLTPLALHALDPNAPPGSNFNLSVWELQLPIGSNGTPTTISNTQLENGFTDSYFFTNSSDGSMAFKDPGTNCVHYSGSNYCRTELREVNTSGNHVAWSPSGTNKLSATLKVVDAGGGITIGQIHLDQAVSSKPLCELYYKSNGDLVMGVEQSTAGGNQIPFNVGHVALGTKFSYVISYSNNKLTVSINGGSATSFDINGDLPGVKGYFKAGDYGQSTTQASDDHFFALTITH